MRAWVLALMLLPSLAQAHAWTREEGHFYLNLSYGRIAATSLYSFDFSKQPIQPYEQNLLGFYGEVGVLSRWLTLSVESQLLREARLVGQGYTVGMGDWRVGAWTGILARPFRLAVGLMAGLPTGDPSPPVPPGASQGSDLVARSLPTGDGEWDFEPRLSAGYSWGGGRRWPVRQYLLVEAGYWIRTRGFSDSFTYRLEVGTQFPFRFLDRFWFIWRFVGVESFASNAEAARDATGLGNGVTYLSPGIDVYGRIWRGLGLSAGVDSALRGRAVPAAVQIRAAISYQY